MRWLDVSFSASQGNANMNSKLTSGIYGKRRAAIPNFMKMQRSGTTSRCRHDTQLESWYIVVFSQQISEQYFSVWLFSETNRARLGKMVNGTYILVRRAHGTPRIFRISSVWSAQKMSLYTKRALQTAYTMS
jgi:hypothetical protein